MNPQPEIRKAAADDLPSILALYLEGEMSDGSLTIERATEIFERIQTYPDYTVFVALVDGVIVGTFALLIMDNLANQGAPSGIVEDVAVGKAWQGKGIGKVMMQFAMDRCSERGCYKLVLSSNAKREAAHRFYESLNFRKHGFSFRVDTR